jgi:indolepyruvate decarboxylase
MLAAPRRRHLLFIGDGSLQMTAQELSTMLRHGLKPIIFVLNNRGYTIERVILGPEAEYNEIQNWNYAGLAGNFAAGRPVRSYVASTEGELEAALARAAEEREFTVIELRLEKMDAPAGLKRMGPQVARFDFGERGPQ